MLSSVVAFYAHDLRSPKIHLRLARRELVEKKGKEDKGLKKENAL